MRSKEQTATSGIVRFIARYLRPLEEPRFIHGYQETTVSPNPIGVARSGRYRGEPYGLLNRRFTGFSTWTPVVSVASIIGGYCWTVGKVLGEGEVIDALLSSGYSIHWGGAIAADWLEIAGQGVFF